MMNLPPTHYVAKVLGMDSPLPTHDPSNPNLSTPLHPLHHYRFEYVDNPNHRCCEGMFLRTIEAPTEEEATRLLRTKVGHSVTIDRCVQLD